MKFDGFGTKRIFRSRRILKHWPVLSGLPRRWAHGARLQCWSRQWAPCQAQRHTLQQSARMKWIARTPRWPWRGTTCSSRSPSRACHDDHCSPYLLFKSPPKMNVVGIEHSIPEIFLRPLLHSHVGSSSMETIGKPWVAPAFGIIQNFRSDILGFQKCYLKWLIPDILGTQNFSFSVSANTISMHTV
jgi:hypothetical protein